MWRTLQNFKLKIMLKIDNMVHKKLPKSILELVLASFFLLQIAIAIANAAGPAPINLGSAGNFAILSKSGISTIGTTSIVGNMGVSPVAATYITGFGLVMNSSGQFSTSSLVDGKIYAADYNSPTPIMLTTAVSDMQTAYNDAAGRSNPNATNLGAGNIGGLTLNPGLYTWSTGVTIPTSVTLDCKGNSSSIFIFQIAQTLTLDNGASIILSGGCTASNVFWQVAGGVTLGTASNFEGIILSQTNIAINTGATLTGAAYAQTAITLDANSVTKSTTGAPATNTSTIPSASSTMPTTSIAISTTAPTTTVAGPTTSPTNSIVGAITPTTTIPQGSSTTPGSSYTNNGSFQITTYDNTFGQVVSYYYNSATGAAYYHLTGMKN